MHYTTLQTQPWRPFPKELRYHDSPEGRIWFDMEAAADKAGYNVFDESKPSGRFTAALEAWRTSRDDVPVAEFGDYVKVTHPASTCASLLDFGAAGLSEPGRVEAFDVGDDARPTKNAYEIVVLADFASRMPCEDVPWLLDKAFAASSGDVVIFATHDGEATKVADAMAQDADWWRGQMQAAAQRVPDRRWMLVLVKAGSGLSSARVIRG